jgi:hypothetical protein
MSERQGITERRAGDKFAQDSQGRKSNVDTLRAPKRDRGPSREQEAKGDGAALGLVVALGLCVLGAIFYVHRHPVGDGGPAGTLMESGGAAGEGGFIAGTSGERRPMAEAPIEKAKALPSERFAGPVVHAAESDACKSLRIARDRTRENLRQRHSEWEAADLKRELDSVISQGTERGCWSGGTG